MRPAEQFTCPATRPVRRFDRYNNNNNDSDGDGHDEQLFRRPIEENRLALLLLSLFVYSFYGC